MFKESVGGNDKSQATPTHQNIFFLLFLTVLLFLPQFLFQTHAEQRNLLDIISLDSRPLSILGVGYFFIAYFWAYTMLLGVDKISCRLPRLGDYLRYAVVFAAALLFIADMFLLYKFDGILDQTKIKLILGTNPYTVSEFLSEYVVSPLCIIIVTLVFAAKMLWQRSILSDLFFLPSTTLSVRLTKYFFVVSILLALDMGLRTGTVFGMFDRIVYFGSSVNRVLIDAYYACDTLGDEEHILALMNDSPEKTVENNADIPYVVFVLGESADRNIMHAYGYNLPNTPLMDERIARGETILFTDTIAPANYTTLAMQYIFTFYDKDSADKWYDYPNLIDILTQNGYFVTWLSNQSPLNIYGNMDDLLGKRANAVEFTDYSGGTALISTRPHDEVLLPLLDKYMAQNQSTSDKQFYIIHLEGSHEIFNRRYPDEFAKFTAADIENETNAKWATVKAEYANSVLYTDYILEEIIKRFANEDCLLVYISDHGEEVYDGRDFVGHSDENLRNRHMTEIPFILWGSEEFWRKRPQLKARMQAAANRPYMTDHFIHFLLDAMQIKTTSYDPTKSIINDKFDSHRVRIYGGQAYKKQ